MWHLSLPLIFYESRLGHVASRKAGKCRTACPQVGKGAAPWPDSWHSPPHLPRPLVLIRILTDPFLPLPTPAIWFRPFPPLRDIYGDSRAGYLPPGTGLSAPTLPTGLIFLKFVPPQSAGANSPLAHANASKRPYSPKHFSHPSTSRTILLPPV